MTNIQRVMLQISVVLVIIIIRKILMSYSFHTLHEKTMNYG